MKYCAECGCPMSDEAKFCMQCGAKQEVQQQNEVEQEVQQQNEVEQEVQQQNEVEQEVQQQSYTQPDQSYIYQQPTVGKSKFEWKPQFIVVGIVVVVLILVVIVFKVVTGGGSGSMEGAIEEYYEAICDQDAEAFLEITCCDSMMKAMEEETGYSEKEMEESLEDYLDYVYEDYSEIKNIEIEDKEKMSKSELKEGLEEIEEETGVNVKISEMYEVKVSFEYYDSYYEEWDEDTDYLTVYKSGSSWYVLLGSM